MKIDFKNQKTIIIIAGIIVFLLIVIVIAIVTAPKKTSEEDSSSTVASQNEEELLEKINEHEQNAGLASTLEEADEYFQEGVRLKNVPITNYDQHVQNLPESERAALQNVLYDTIAMNYSKKSPVTIRDVVIRDDSYQQTLEGDYYTTSFMLDIPSIQQSYRVSHSWSPTEELNQTSYRYLILCPKSEELIYPNFKCTDAIRQEAGV
ncbi:hypothetical protein FWF93_00055 [Candidatus Saccharibacteria bacterium]|nr:hypothetical protein [Candidatus Saccharibacteria bacterium]